MQHIWQAGKKCYLPQLTSEKTLHFALYEQNDPLVPNQYNIPEPLPRAPIISPEELDLVLVPLVAFAANGQRLGTGGGYYDRTFAFLRAGKNPKPKLIGYAFAAQKAESLPVDSWDLQLHVVVTEEDIGSPE